MRALFARLARIAASDLCTLIVGETGTGKDLTAEAIHDASPRVGAPLVVIDCGAIPSNLIESELFGHERGAFTGATTAHAGAFERARATAATSRRWRAPPASTAPSSTRSSSGTASSDIVTVRPGDTLHRYRLDECVGVGGMAQVFRATALGAEGFEKAVAIKRILPSLAGEAFQRRFVTEAKLSAQLTHPNIVQVIDFGPADGSLYIAMEYVDGVDVLALRERGPGSHAPLAAALYVALATCRGLAFAHAQGVVHRDVSPSNILLSVTGAVKVADFGIAHTVDGQSRPRQIVGKLCYMSPEQIRGDAIDARTDIFSAGIVFHELFASRRLFRGRTFDELREAIARQPIPSLSSDPIAPRASTTSFRACSPAIAPSAIHAVATSRRT